MTVHVLHAGDGYSYLTRQVAAGDNTVERGQDLTDYYTAEGSPPGVWVGSGADVLGVSGEVSEAQMKALFGEGLHPDADRIIAEHIAAGMDPKAAVQEARLGRRFMVTAAAKDDWDTAISAAYAEVKAEHGRLPEVGVERDLLRWTVASGRASSKLDRAPTDAEISQYLAWIGKPTPQPVAGYDLVFTPVKSVSVLWALGDRETSGAVRAAHNAAWQDTVAWLEKEAALTRVGAGGVGQINTNGLAATAFEHRDSRTGDPNLHTHVAVSTKVQGVDGKWRSLDGRVLHALGVAASERYNTLIEKELRERLGVSFVDETRGRNKRVVREIEGVPQELRDAFSARRAAIEDAYAELLAEYVAKHGHTPPKNVQLSLAQEATLATRVGKEEPKSLELQRAQWHATAVNVLGERRVAALSDVVKRHRNLTPEDLELAAKTIDQLADDVVGRVEMDRSTWRESHLQAEALRVARAYADVRRDVDATDIAEQVSALAVARSIGITAPDLNPVPNEMRRADGESIYRVHASARFTSARILGVEDDLLKAARTPAGFTTTPTSFTATVDRLNAASEHPLNASQVELARRFASGGNRVEVGIGPAGTGKTTAMRAFARAVEADGGRVLALAPTAVASTVLADEIDVEAETAHKLVWVHKYGSDEQKASAQYRVDANTILLIDEAGMASTPLLADVLELAEKHGASIRLLGDPAQLAAVESGGALRLIETRAGASYLQEVHRFIRKDEAAATLQLRVGDIQSLDFYTSNKRTRGGLRQTMLDEIYAAWSVDRERTTVKGTPLQSIMVAGTNDEVAALNARARLDLIAAGTVTAEGVTLHDGNKAGVGDIIVTRQNDRTLRTNQGKDFVANGDLWTVQQLTKDGLKVKSLRHGGVLTLPPEYAAKDVELGYAATINRVQGMTVDTSHILVDPTATTREQLYVAATRGRESNRMYAVVDDVFEVDMHAPDQLRTSIMNGLRQVLARESAELSATETIQKTVDEAASLATLVPRYEDARLRLLEPERLERLTSSVVSILPADLAEQVTTSEAWGALAQRLLIIEATGTNPAAALRGVIGPREIDGVQPIHDPAKVFHYRLGDLLPATTTDPGTPETLVPAWVTPVPTGKQATTPVGLWTIDQNTLISDRITALVDETAQTMPEWATPLGTQPDSGPERNQWRRDLALIVAYRDLHQVTDTSSALGSAPAHSDEARKAADAALRRFRTQHTPEPTSQTPRSDPTTAAVWAAAARHNTAAETQATPRSMDELLRQVTAVKEPQTPGKTVPTPTPTPPAWQTTVDQTPETRPDDPTPVIDKRKGPRI